ncbi:HD domain-containing protein [Burkholderia sp. RF2-non_BP3]|uniref:HD domain-containing protein n=1 Tax=Burkholderia sp. RF2-non_BP3 TaxID=1637844 RepID=UPI000B0F65AE|nr:HD domain-containing protein [Burkholderia sp. RF2-non_BP3]
MSIGCGVSVAVLDAAAAADATLEVRFAALAHDLGKGVTPAAHWPKHHDHERLCVPLVKAICARWRVPAACRDLALTVCQEHTLVHGVARLQAATIVRLLSRMGALRRPERLDAVLLACACDARGRLGFEHQAYPFTGLLLSPMIAALAMSLSPASVISNALRLSNTKI